MTKCSECNGTGFYQPLLGPAEACGVCNGRARFGDQIPLADMHPPVTPPVPGPVQFKDRVPDPGAELVLVWRYGSAAWRSLQQRTIVHRAWRGFALHNPETWWLPMPPRPPGA